MTERLRNWNGSGVEAGDTVRASWPFNAVTPQQRFDLPPHAATELARERPRRSESPDDVAATHCGAGPTVNTGTSRRLPRRARE